MVAGAVGAAQLNDVPSGHTARNCTRAVGSGSSVSGALKSRVLLTNSVPWTTEPSAHVKGTSQNASACSSKKSVFSADAGAANAAAAISIASAATSRPGRPEAALIMMTPLERCTSQGITRVTSCRI
jgi:hypothetical protein